MLTLSVSASAKGPTIIAFDPPGSILTEAFDINPEGAITGGYLDASSVVHGFLRDPDGTFTTIDAPGAQGTLTSTVDGLNPAGAISGGYVTLPMTRGSAENRGTASTMKQVAIENPVLNSPLRPHSDTSDFSKKALS
jgi:hypothetical protein